MRVKVLNEAGFNEALYGISLNKNQPIEKMEAVSLKLYDKDGGHNKFLEMMMIWLEVDASRWWWSQADTYRVGVCKSSESTMHTLHKRLLTQEDFRSNIPESLLQLVNQSIEQYNNKQIDINQLKDILPEGFLQKRVWMLSYKTLINILKQRETDRTEEWQQFCKQIRQLVSHKQYLPQCKGIIGDNERV